MPPFVEKAPPVWELDCKPIFLTSEPYRYLVGYIIVGSVLFSRRIIRFLICRRSFEAKLFVYDFELTILACMISFRPVTAASEFEQTAVLPMLP